MNAPSLGNKILATCSVMSHFGVRAMCGSVNFNNQLVLSAREVGKIRTDGKLPHKFEISKPPGPQGFSQQAFGLRVVLSQRTRSITGFYNKIGHGD
jgi:hypothetical protein